MPERARAAISAWLLLCCSICVCSWSACMGPNLSTDTGIRVVPGPGLTDGLYSFKAIGADLEIVGEAGAVLPGGSTIEVEDRDSHEVTRVKSDADGSFHILVRNVSASGISIRVLSAGARSDEVSWPGPVPEPQAPREDAAGSRR